MSEKIVRAKRWDQLWFIPPNGRGWDIISIIAWAIPDSGPAIPITAFGRIDASKPYIVGNGNGYIAFPSGNLFSNDSALRHFLDTGEAQGEW
jgi:hypothetical protein